MKHQRLQKEHWEQKEKDVQLGKDSVVLKEDIDTFNPFLLYWGAWSPDSKM